MLKYPMTLILLTSLTLCSVEATDRPQIAKKQTLSGLYLTAFEAYKLKQKEGNNALFVDIRTPSELVFVGSPKNTDIDIPFLRMDYDQWDDNQGGFKKIPNHAFLQQMATALKIRKLNKESPIILICRSGSRSAKAANLLTREGYKNVYTVVDGFEGDKSVDASQQGKRTVNGWKNSGLPWSYKLDQNKLVTQNLSH